MRTSTPKANRKVRLLAASLLMAFATLAVVVLPTQVASAATDEVTTCSGDATVPGSLPYEVANASSGDTISFSVTCPVSSPIILRSGIPIHTNLTIAGTGATSIVVSGGGFYMPGVTVTVSGFTVEDVAGSPFYSDGGGTLTLQDMAISNNEGNVNIEDGGINVIDSVVDGNSGSYGGGLTEYGGGLTVTDSTISNNTSNSGGGIFNNGGDVTITGSTISDNTSYYGGAGISNQYDGTLNIMDSTIAGNSSISQGGGGIYSTGGPVTITSSTIAENAAVAGSNNNADGGGGVFSNGGTVSLAGSIVSNNGSAGDCSATITDAGYNLDDDGSCGFSGTSLSNTPAGLDPTGLQYNGGPAETIALVAGSPAIGAVNSASLCSTPDQREVPRPTPCDIGAVQLVIRQAISSPNHATASASSAFSFTVTTDGLPVPAITEKGKLPKGLKFANNGNGTATISGTPKKKVVKHLTITATFGSGTSRYVVSQAFTLTVTSR